MGGPFDILDQLRARLHAHAPKLPRSSLEGMVSLVLSLPEAPAQAPSLSGAQFHFRHPHREEMQVGYGIAAEWRAWGGDRLGILRDQARELRSTWHLIDPEATSCHPFALLGFAARPAVSPATRGQDLPNALLRVPEIALRAHPGRAALILNAFLPASTTALLARWLALIEEVVPALYQPPPKPLPASALRRELETPTAKGWHYLLRRALDRIDNQDFQKVVLARRLRVTGSRPFDITRLLATLSTSYPSCQILSIRHGERTFVAATPERLLSLHGNRVEVDALAGTSSRAAEAGRDGALAQALRCSAKNLHEHRLVIEAIRDALAPVAARIDIPAEPDIMRLANVHHLWTRIGARFEGSMDVFTLAELLHPTPATNGEPRREASAWLNCCDPFERGWYTGAAGIVEPDLSGELWVLLRCADIQEHTADLYAGAGIVEGSDPALEWRETEHKLGAMLSALRYA
ncbi:MAG: isochorismate synthase [Chromatiaceae bacterium]|nr:isochorismate synthase [Candidatus Thioaporhodococcus sediminis]